MQMHRLNTDEYLSDENHSDTLSAAATTLDSGNNSHNSMNASDSHLLLLSADQLDEINQSAELRCLLQEHIESQSFGNSSDFCLTQFDTILCWPRTLRGTLAVLPCLNEFKGIKYDISKNATRFCDLNGEWDKYTDYDSCVHLPAPSTVPEFEPIIELPMIIYFIGYTISLVSLTLAIIVFIYFKELRCLRNSIHANLFFTYIMSALFWILTLSVQIYIRTGLGACFILVILLHFFTLTNFFWMLVEGLYLYMLVVKTFSGDNIRFNIYALIGWGGPAVCVVIWMIAKSQTSDSPASEKLVDIGCPWMHETHVDWIFQGPVCVVLLINLIFLLRIMWVLITKLRSANTVETRQYRKAAKALLVLIPLFGITYLVVLAGPNEDGVMSHMFAVMRAVLLSTQGFSVSLLYCFLNSEVRSALRHHLSRWQDSRNIQLDQSKRYTTKTFSKNNSHNRAESTRPLTAYYGKGKRESCISSTTTTTLLSQNPPPMTLQRGSNGALHMLPTTATITVMPKAISPLMKQGLEENSV